MWRFQKHKKHKIIATLLLFKKKNNIIVINININIIGIFLPRNIEMLGIFGRNTHSFLTLWPKHPLMSDSGQREHPEANVS